MYGYVLQRTPIIMGSLALLIILAGSVGSSRAQNEGTIPWSDWTAFPDNYQDLVIYRTVSFADTIFYSGTRTEYEVCNQYSFSVSFIINVSYNDGDGIPQVETLNWHLGPSASGLSVADSPTITAISLESISFHTSDPIPQ